MQYYYGKILALYGASPDYCYAYFDGGVQWKRLPNICTALAAEAKSDNRFVAIVYQGWDVAQMYVY